MAFSFAISSCGCVQVLGEPDCLYLSGSSELPAYYIRVTRLRLGDNVVEINQTFFDRTELIDFLNNYNFDPTYGSPTGFPIAGTFELSEIPGGGICYTNPENYPVAIIMAQQPLSDGILKYYKIGNPLNPLPDELYTREYANGSVFDISEIYGKRIQAHFDNALVEENDLGYSRIDTVITTVNPRADCNLTILLAGTYDPLIVAGGLQSNDGQFILDSNNQQISTNA